MTDAQPTQEPDGAATLAERIAALGEGLSPAERRVATFIGENPEHVLYLSAQRIAKQARTSDATVVRTAKTLGYSGLGDLKRSIGLGMSPVVHPATRLERRLQAAQGDPEHDLLGQVSVDAMERIETTLGMVPAEVLSACIDHLFEAKSVLCFGPGVSSTAAEYATKKFSRLGLIARHIGGMGFDTADDLMQLRAGDCVVVFCPGRLFREIEVILDRAERLSVPVVLITSGLPAEVRERMSVVIDIAASPGGLTGETLMPLLLVDAILLGLGARDRSRATASSRLLNETRRLIETRDGGLLRYR